MSKTPEEKLARASRLISEAAIQYLKRGDTTHAARLHTAQQTVKTAAGIALPPAKKARRR